ncbi:hypothetical protein [Gordonibacter sp. Marseille-P4307]|uniref:hypothetical protein n=1 Tax=Gordonibacter sp. Marseille-P4307 TaxID=2161815 RepID=UPI000F534068|nr:hypothetical protein [Gordonibacter sp. Marseille-P4307]
METVEGAVELQRELHRWKPRQTSFWTMLFSVFAVIALAIAMLEAIRDQPDAQTYSLFAWLHFIPLEQRAWIAIAGASAIAAIAAELISRFRIPPATWRVKVELQRALIDLGLLDGDDTRRWRGVFWCAPFGKYSRQEKLYTLLFDCRTVKAKPETFKELEQCIAGFHRSQDAAVEIYKRRGKRTCYRLMLWYGTNSYEKGLKDVAPW